jgi:hypothetical protein
MNPELIKLNKDKYHSNSSPMLPNSQDKLIMVVNFKKE